MQPVVSEWPALFDPSTDRLILRDGSVAIVRATATADRAMLRQFFHTLGPESRYNRFFTTSEPPDTLLERFCDSADPARQLTLVALRQAAGELRPIAVASYAATGASTAEAGFAVADGIHGQGLGTALLERLAAIAHAEGFDYFDATTLAGNAEMLRVFRDSGFERRATSSQGVVGIRLDLRLAASGLAAIDERSRAATVASLRPILQPQKVAVIGVSRDPANFGRRIYDGLLREGFKGSVYAVNPSAAEIAGRRCYRSVRELPGGVDLAVIATPRSDVLQVVDECAQAGVNSLIIVSAGFAETGEEGRRLQRDVLDKARANGMRLVGPNCMGVLNTNPDVRLNASFAGQLPPEGGVSIASQSGGIGLALLQLAAAKHVGISSFVSLGNKADVSGNDLLQWGESDPRTSVLLLYLESFGNPRRFGQLARRIGHKKPIVVVKAGRTPAGSRAAGSHTAGLASSETAVDALFKQSGVIRADTIDEMFDIAQCLDLQPLPCGMRVGIVTNTGGPGILAADACEGVGLVVTPFGADTRTALARSLSSQASIGNPVDLVASAGGTAYEHATATVLASPDVDSLLVIYTPIDHTQTDDILAGISRGVVKARAAGVSNKPVLACILSVESQPAPIQAGDERIPTYIFPENASRALGRAAVYAQWRKEPPPLFRTFDDIQTREARALCQSVVAARGDTWLTAEELRRVLDAFGLRLAAGGAAHTEEEAASEAAIVGFPVVLKLQSPRVLHKTDVGGVRLDLRDAQEVRTAFREIAARFPDGLKPGGDAFVQVQPMFTGVETLVGVADDSTFGPLVAFGLGGIETEILRDVAFRIAPLSECDVRELMHAIRSFPLLQGHRGRPAADVDALQEILLRVSLLAQHVPELRELDLNPVIVLPAGQGCRIVDARGRVAAV